MTVKGGSRPACAACRFQRRRCSSDCPLAPYFPANQPQVFQNVHSLYGVGHVMKILNQLQDNDQKDEAMTSIKYESNIRQINRVHGCCAVLFQLQRRLNESVEELNRIRRILDAYKRNRKPMQDYSRNNDQVVGESGDWINAMMNGGGDLGVYCNPLGDHAASYDHRDDDKMKTTIDVTQIEPNQSRFDQFQKFEGVEQDDDDQESPDYTEIMCDWNHRCRIEHIFIEPEPEESKVDEKMVQGVHYVTTG